MLTISSMQPSETANGTSGRSVTSDEARQAARLARVGLKLSSTFSAITLPAGVSVRHAKERTSEKGRQQSRRAGPTYVVGIGDMRFEKPVINHLWRMRQLNEAKQLTR